MNRRAGSCLPEPGTPSSIHREEKYALRSWRRHLGVGVTMAVGSALLLSSCATPESRSTGGGADIDPAVTDALVAEGPTAVVDVTDQPEVTIQTEIIAEIINQVGGEIEIVPMAGPPVLSAIAESDNMFVTDFWRQFYEEGYQQYIVEDESVAVIGPVAYATEEGWYVPDYVIEGDEERGIEPTCPGLPDWEALNDCVDVFATAKTGDKGQYTGGPAAWSEINGDPHRIENLGLNYEIVYAGSPAALGADLAATYDRGDPWLGFMWRPNYPSLKYDLTRIEFPPNTDECWGNTWDCQWPDFEVLKVGSTALQEAHPTVWKFLENYDFDREDLFAAMSLVEEDGMTPREAAKAWVAENPERWQPWFS